MVTKSKTKMTKALSVFSRIAEFPGGDISLNYEQRNNGNVKQYFYAHLHHDIMTSMIEYYSKDTL